MNVLPIPCLKDNYAYLLFQDQAAEAAIVDPSEAGPVLKALAERGLRLSAILCTHHHHDHVGGNIDLLERYPGIPVYGHKGDHSGQRIPGQTLGLDDHQQIDVVGEKAEALFIPGHTLGAVAYYFAARNLVFTGDTLFGAGCGRMFEGTPPMMHESLSRLQALPPVTQVYCGHEYTESNLRFAAAVEPGNQAIYSRRDRVAAARAAGLPSVPSTMAEESETNPFLRVAEPTVRLATSREDPKLPPDAQAAEVFGALRRWKDHF